MMEGKKRTAYAHGSHCVCVVFTRGGNIYHRLAVIANRRGEFGGGAMTMNKAKILRNSLPPKVVA